MSNGKIVRHLPPLPDVAEVGFIEEFIDGVGQGTPYFVYKITEGLAEPSNPPALEEMATFTKGSGRTAYSVAKLA